MGNMQSALTSVTLTSHYQMEKVGCVYKKVPSYILKLSFREYRKTSRFTCCNKQRSEIDKIIIYSANKVGCKINCTVKSLYLIFAMPV